MNIKCTKCELSQNESEFYRDSSRNSGYGSYCKKCVIAYRQSPESKEYHKKYRQSPKNKETKKQYSKKYRQSPKYKESRKKYAQRQQALWSTLAPEFRVITCIKCKVSQNESRFSRNSSSKNGHCSQCKKCVIAYRQSPKYKESRKKYAQRQQALWSTLAPEFRVITCTKCKVSQNESDFSRNSSKKNGYCSQCKKCSAAYRQSPEYNEAERLRVIRYKHRKPIKNGMITCSRCKVSQNESGFHKDIGAKNGYTSWCKNCNRMYHETLKKENPVLYRAKMTFKRNENNCKKYRIPFDITVQDLIDMQKESDTCQCCSGPFDFNVGGSRKHKPTLDRIIPELGYVRSNVKMICHTCNRIKNNGTLEQLEQIVRYMKKHQELIV